MKITLPWEMVMRRFWAKVNKNGPMDYASGTRCWVWTGSTAKGYGMLRIGRKTVRANRLAWRYVTGAPPTTCVLHRCDNPPCVNPAHLFLGSQVENIKDMNAKGRYVSANALKTKCKRGHELVGENLVVVIRKDGSRSRKCVACSRLRDRISWKRQKCG